MTITLNDFDINTNRTLAKLDSYLGKRTDYSSFKDPSLAQHGGASIFTSSILFAAAFIAIPAGFTALAVPTLMAATAVGLTGLSMMGFNKIYRGIRGDSIDDVNSASSTFTNTIKLTDKAGQPLVIQEKQFLMELNDGSAHQKYHSVELHTGNGKHEMCQLPKDMRQYIQFNSSSNYKSEIDKQLYAVQKALFLDNETYQPFKNTQIQKRISNLRAMFSKNNTNENTTDNKLKM